MDDIQNLRWILELVIVGFAVVLWWMLRSVIADLSALAKALSEYKLHVAETYVTQGSLTKAIDNFSNGIGEVFRKLERIEDKLDSKQDKA